MIEFDKEQPIKTGEETLKGLSTELLADFLVGITLKCVNEGLSLSKQETIDWLNKPYEGEKNDE